MDTFTALAHGTAYDEGRSTSAPVTQRRTRDRRLKPRKPRAGPLRRYLRSVVQRV